MGQSENPLFYRLERNQARTSTLGKWGQRVCYPAAVLLPAWLLGLGNKQPFLFGLVTLFLHTLYFCGRPLLDASNGLVSEKQRGTFTSLQATPLGSQGWIAALLRQYCAPRLAELMCFGWVLGILPGAGPTLAILIYTASCIIVYAAAGLWLSQRSESPTRLQLQALLLLAGTFFLTVPLDWSMHAADLPLSRLVNPCLVTFTQWQQGFAGGIVLATLGQLALAGLLLWSTVGSLREASRPVSLKRAATWSALCGRVQNPLLYRSFLRADLSPLRWLAYPFFLLGMRGLTSHHRGIAVSLGLYLALVGSMVYFTIRGLLAGCPALAGEREKRTWESLLSTSLTPQALYLGQWAALILPVLLEFWVWSFLWVIYARPTGGELEPVDLWMLLFYNQAWTLFVGTLALSISQSSATTSSAFLMTVAVILALSLGTLCVDAALFHDFDRLSLLSPIRGLTLLLVGRHWERGLASALAFLVATPIVLLQGCYRSHDPSRVVRTS